MSAKNNFAMPQAEKVTIQGGKLRHCKYSIVGKAANMKLSTERYSESCKGCINVITDCLESAFPRGSKCTPGEVVVARIALENLVANLNAFIPCITINVDGIYQQIIDMKQAEIPEEQEAPRPSISFSTPLRAEDVKKEPLDQDDDDEDIDEELDDTCPPPPDWESQPHLQDAPSKQED